MACTLDLMEVPPLAANIALPIEGLAHWVAVDSGLFKECDEDDARIAQLRSGYGALPGVHL